MLLPKKALEDRARILSYSRNKFHKEGFFKTSMDEIARDLQVSKKTIYKYFPSKEKLLEEMCVFTTGEINAKVSDIVNGKDNVIIKFVRLWNLYSEFSLDISEKWLNDLRTHAPEIKKAIDSDRDDKIRVIMIKLIEQGKKEKIIENFPTPVIINIFIAAIRAIINPDFIIKNKLTMQSAFRSTYDILMHGILTSKGKEQYSKEKKKLRKELNLQ